MLDSISGFVIILIAAIFVLFSIILVVAERLNVRKTMKNLDDMLDRAIDGTFTAERIDETMLSSLEFKMGKYLSAAETSAKNVENEKDNIKTLISDISHQTKTPISSILLYGELLKEQDLDEVSAGYVDAVNEQAHKLNFLISALIKMSRLETGILTLHPVYADVMDLLKKAQEQFAPEAVKKGLDFTLVPAGEDTDVWAVFDEKWTLEAICNIIDNAVKYTFQGGITIKVISYPMFLCIEIADTGIGIEEEEQAQVFSRFYRSQNVADKSGVGIGLYLAREIISSEGGYIKLTSGPKEGSSFAVYLPKSIS